MIVHQDADGSLLPAVSAAPRALVILTVPWSGPERIARLAFRAAAELLAAQYANLGIAFFSVEEDSEWGQRWLAGLEVPRLGGGYPLGAGTLVWLELGRHVASEVSGAGLRAVDIVGRSLRLWGPAEPAAAADRGRFRLF